MIVMLAKFCALDSDFYKKLYFPAGLFIVTELIYLVALGIFRSGSSRRACSQPWG